MRVLAALLIITVACANDPAPGLKYTRREARNFECIRLAHQEAHDRFPGVVPPVAARSMPEERTEALICEPRFLSLTDRPPRDEAILLSLRQTVGQLTALASALNPGPVRWHVDAFYPEQTVAAKIATAAKVELFEHGRLVSDRVPLLAAGDVSVLSHLPPERAYAVACERYFAEHVLSENDVFLGLMLVDPSETQLHAGLCQAGRWRWVQ